MPLTTIAEFEIDKLEILDVKGKADKNLMPKLSKKQVLGMYKAMLLTRAFDEEAIILQKQGRLGTYASQLGQEASIIGPAYALSKRDWLVPSFRESGAMLTKGAAIENVMQYWAGDERGSKLSNLRILPVSIPVGTQALHATGIAWGMKKLKEQSAVLVYFGDGATSEGDFHEALNFSGVFKLPVVFLCQNNQYAISMPSRKQTASKTIAQKAIAYGIKWIQVDGNDIFATYSATKNALEDAKKGMPTLIESFTYRRGNHTTSDDAKKYRTEREVKEWERKDPIERLEKYMTEQKMLTKTLKNRMLKEARRKVDEAVKNIESEKTEPEDIFKYTYAQPTEEIEEQLEEFRENAK